MEKLLVSHEAVNWLILYLLWQERSGKNKPVCVHLMLKWFISIVNCPYWLGHVLKLSSLSVNSWPWDQLSFVPFSSACSCKQHFHNALSDVTFYDEIGHRILWRYLRLKHYCCVIVCFVVGVLICCTGTVLIFRPNNLW